MSDQVASVVQSAADHLQADISTLLASNLGLPAGSIIAHPDTRVLGAIPEMDSMSVVTVLIFLEEQYGIVIHDDEMDAAVFETLGSLTKFVQSKLD